MNYFISAIGTDSGKTVASAILAEALSADYWKPVQAGCPTDSDIVRQWVSEKVILHPEQYRLRTPASPHHAAAIESLHIGLNSFMLPQTTKDLIIEGAGGLLVPLNDTDKMIDLVPLFNAEIILVCNIYLGCINHSLLSIEAIQSRGYPLKGIIFNGPDNPSSKEIILHHAKVPVLLDIKEEKVINSQVIRRYAEILKNKWNELGSER